MNISKADARGQANDAKHVLLFGLGYFILLFIYLQIVNNVDARILPRRILESPVALSIIQNWVSALGLCVLTAVIIKSVRASGPLAEALKPLPITTTTRTVVVVAVGSFVLNTLGWWPWSYREPTGGVIDSYIALARLRSVFATTTFVLAAGFVIPFIEEVVFRFGLLRVLRNKFDSDVLAIVGSSAIFSALHLRNLLDIQPFTLVNCAWLFVMSSILGYIVLRYSGNIVIAIVAHVTRNITELTLALFGAYLNT